MEVVFGSVNQDSFRFGLFKTQLLNLLEKDWILSLRGWCLDFRAD
jgi:hypothetical protein